MTPTEWLDWLKGGLIVGIGWAGSWLVKRTASPGERTERWLADQLQEELASRDKRIGEQDNKLSNLQEQIDSLRNLLNTYLTRDTLWGVHVIRQDALITNLGGTPLPLPEQLQPIHHD